MSTFTKHHGASIQRQVATEDLLMEALLGGVAEQVKKLAQNATFSRGSNANVLKGCVDGFSFAISRSGNRNFAPGFPVEAKQLLIGLIADEFEMPINRQRGETPALRAP